MQHNEQEKFNVYAALYYCVILLLIITSIYIISSKERRENFVGGFSELSYRLGFRVNSFAVNDVQNIEIEDLIEQIAVADKPILVLDLDKVRERVEKNSWVKEATVARVLPNQIKIIIDEHKPKAIWQDGDRFYIVDKVGKIIKEITLEQVGNYSELIIITGEDARFNLIEMFKFIDYNEAIKSEIKGAVYVSERRWDIIMINDMIVKLPSHNPLQSWKYFVSLNDELDLTNNNVVSIDLRAPDLLFLELDPKSQKNRKLLKMRK